MLADAALAQERALRGIVGRLLWSLTMPGLPCQCSESGQGIVSYGAAGDCYAVGHTFVCQACRRQTPWCWGMDGDELCDECAVQGAPWERRRGEVA